MIESELILLGLLKESPKHGYEIKKRIKEILSVFTGADLKSIYYPLRIMEKKGLILKRSGRQGKRPTRNVYELTSKGENRFQVLLSKSFLDFKRPQFSLDLSLLFLNYIKPAIVCRRLKARIFVLNSLSRDLTQTIKIMEKKETPYPVSILRHNLELVEAEVSFLRNLIKTL
ncbi:MAG: PadR family transcriptional regulator [Candidatus Omnitrophota bacterium]|nr:PadR family transcriptional regulator [Candidatus Omnitrophota bacterium]MBU1928659.1 PadR family transcriptional regulator [Candidatus Omnitrophota bacterium]MBU2035776.1 PadR family transcriptional regulator [Candidatus Omnitrophota bacterium]MBU2222102.1 PadR family transcriptional regulator [Candidatus Omnitrophota bacterium]MBU2258334.1 PadR family transcriptional regulator [Candidatus Omnitrophota bacterium]